MLPRAGGGDGDGKDGEEQGHHGEGDCAAGHELTVFIPTTSDEWRVKYNSGINSINV